MSMAISTPDRVVSLPPVKEELHDVFLELPRFKGISEKVLIQAAKQTPGGNRILINDRLTAIVVLVGTRKLDDPFLRTPLRA